MITPISTEWRADAPSAAANPVSGANKPILIVSCASAGATLPASGLLETPVAPSAGRRGRRERTMIQITFSLPEGALASVRHDPDTFTRELRLAAAVKWYELHRISQGRAAEIAGLSRAEFIDALGRYEVSPFQQTADEIVADAEEAGHG